MQYVELLSKVSEVTGRPINMTETPLITPMAIAEISLDALLMNFGSHKALKPVPAYPAVKRDLALVVSDNVSNGDIVKTITKAAPKTLTDVTLFDIFKPKTLEGAKRSLAYSLEFRSPDRTLTDDEVNAACEKIMTVLKNTLGAEVRAN